MSVRARVSHGVSINGLALGGSRVVEADAQITVDKSVPAGKVGTLSTRTDNDTGTVTGPADHGITTGLTVDLYWSGGSRRGVTVGTVSGTSIPIDGGTGDNLPAQAASITVAVRTQVELPVIGDNAQVIAIGAPNGVDRVTASIQDGSGELLGVVLSDARAWVWDADSGVTNPLAGETSTQVFLSHGSTSARTVRVVVSYNT